MKFDITRISTRDKKPCAKAIAISRPYFDQRTCKSAKELPNPDSWLKTGTGHGVNKTGIYRYLGYETVYQIEINSLEELIKFTKKHGEIVFTENSIEIYDDYRE